MILEPGEIALLHEIAAWRRTAHAGPDPFASNMAQEHARRALDLKLARQKLEEFYAVAFASREALVLPEGAEYLGARVGPKGTELWFNSAPFNEAGDRDTFCIALTKEVAGRQEAKRLERKPGTRAA